MHTPTPRPARLAPGEWLNRFLASDPGLTRLRTAAQAVVSVGIALLAEWIYVQIAHPLTVPEGTPGAEAINRAAGVMCMMAGAMVCMISTFVGPMYATTLKAIGALVLLPASLLVGIAIGLGLAPYGTTGLIVMVLILGASGFLRRFGANGFTIGQGLFMGDFLGMFLGRLTDLSGLGWIAGALAIGCAVAILAYLAMFLPSRSTAVRRLRRSFLRRADVVAAASVDLLEHPESAARRKRQVDQLIRLNETALMIDAQLAESPRLPLDTTAEELHRLVFGAELSLANAARFARAMTRLGIPDEGLALAREPFLAIRRRDPQGTADAGERVREWIRSSALSGDARVVMHRFATSVSDYAEVIQVLAGQRFGRRDRRVDDDFLPAVTLAGGWLPGSSKVSATASEEGSHQRLSARLHPSVRLGIQMTVAGIIAIVVGAIVSQERFSWAVIAAFVTFMGANNAAEQVRKGAFRVIGTVIGVVIGALLAHLVGPHPYVAIAVILAALFVGMYMMRVSYAFFTAALTILIAQLYVQLAEYSEQLLGLRLFETIVGSGAAVVTVIFVLPLRTGRVVRVATRELVEALSKLVGPAMLRIRDSAYEAPLRAAARDLDASFQALAAATEPKRAVLRVPGSLGGVEQQWWFAANAAHSYARDLLIDSAHVAVVAGPKADEIAEAGQVLIASMNELMRGLGEHSTKRIYTRSASRFESVAKELDDAGTLSARQLSLRDLQLIDGALAALATAAGLEVRALDTPEDVPA